MGKVLTIEDIDERVRHEVYTQDYAGTEGIDGVKLAPLKDYPGEDGEFEQLIRISKDGEVEGFSGFKIAQINRTRLLPGAVKAWHLHFEQDELWYALPSAQLFVGLWDLRRGSPTNNKTMRIVLGAGQDRILYIPRGVAHGMANFTTYEANLLYIVNNTFKPEEADEKRINWDVLGPEFWTPKRD